MDFELLIPLVAILALFIGMPIAIFAGIARVKQASAAAGSELTARELRDLVYEAAYEAQAPVIERLERLERLAAGDLQEDPQLESPEADQSLEADSYLLPERGRRTR